MTRQFKTTFLAFVLIAVALIFRIYNLNFGLPHSFYADEPEFSELAIKYTYQLRNIIKNNDYQELIPISYVYGTFPVYFLTVALMGFSKTLNLLNVAFDKTTIFVFFRSLMVIVSLAIVWLTALLSNKLFAKNGNITAFIALALTALNYKLIVHAHYVNADVILTLLILGSFYLAYLYNTAPTSKNLLLMGFVFGLAAGTKITALISAPLFLFLIIKKKDVWGIAGFIFTTILAFVLTNPFSVIFFNDFSYRIFSMLTKEGGMVFDSVDSNPLKYISALIEMVSGPILVSFVYGIFLRLKNRKSDANTEDFEKTFDIFLIANFVLYLIFFSIQSRRVDRWLLPILPIVLIYASYGIENLVKLLDKKIYKIGFAILVSAFYLYYPVLLLTQFQRWTPKSEAYRWANENLPELSRKLVYTEEGLDPMNKLGNADVIQFNVYVSEGAALFYPADPMTYDYVIVSSRPMQNFKKPAVEKAHPNFVKAWKDFEDKIENPDQFELVKDFTLTKPNLIPLSDVFIYKKL